MKSTPGKPVASAKIFEDTLWKAIAFVQWLNISTKAIRKEIRIKQNEE